MTLEVPPIPKHFKKLRAGGLLRPNASGTGPAMPRLGELEVRLAETEGEMAESQALRYRVFYEEMNAKATPEMAALGRDFDRFDAFCDHLIVIDHRRKSERVVGTYRLLRHEAAMAHGGFYTQGEFDVAELMSRVPQGTRFLELGRTCVRAGYRNKPTIELLWLGILSYLSFYEFDVMIGCASLHGTNPKSLALPLAFLYHNYLAPPQWRAHAHADRYVPMNVMAKDDIDVREAVRLLPTLIRGYVRAGGFVGDGAVVDEQFNTTDVMIIFPVSEMNDRFLSRFSRVADQLTPGRD